MQLKKKDMQSYRQKTEPLYPVPKRVQELIPVYRIAKDGVFQIERTGEDGQALFDKAYLFSDTNFTPMDDREKGEFLKQYCSALNSLNVPFKLLVLNQNRDMDRVRRELFLRAEPEYGEEQVTEPEVEEPEVEEPEPKKTETEKKAHGWRAFFGIHKKHEEPVKEEKEEEKPEIQYHEFDYSEDGESGELAEEFLPDEPEEAETYAAETETAAYENAEQLNTNYDAGHQNRYAQENEEDLFTSTEEDLEKGELNPYTGHEYESNSVRMHPNRIGYVQVYDRGTHQWTDMTEWAFLGYQERKKALLGKDYEPPIYLD